MHPLELRTSVLNSLQTNKLKLGQLDVNGKCNAACWYCPVKYEEIDPKFQEQMSVEILDKIFTNIRSSSVITPAFDFLYTCHYNEIFLHKDVRGLFQVFRDHKFKTIILSNGTPVTPEKIKLTKEYSDVVNSICLNIPDLVKKRWSLKAGFSESVFKILTRNLDALHDSELEVTIQINTVSESNAGNSGRLGIITTNSELSEIKDLLARDYPRFKISVLENLSNRASFLSKHEALKPSNISVAPVVGCNHSGSRIYEWLHINNKGDLFLCCDDYSMRYIFGNIVHTPLDEVWTSTMHVDKIIESFNNLCLTCSAAKRQPEPKFNAQLIDRKCHESPTAIQAAIPNLVPPTATQDMATLGIYVCRQGRFLLPKLDLYLGKSLMEYGEWTEGLNAVFAALFIPGGVAIEVGASFGAHTIPLARLAGSEGQVIAIEQSRRMVDLLHANVALNAVDNVSVMHIRLGATAGSIKVAEPIFTSSGNFGMISQETNIDGRKYSVPVVQLDSQPYERVNLLFIDTPGEVSGVLEGAKHMILLHKPILVLNADNTKDSVNVQKTAMQLGYTLWEYSCPFYTENNFLANKVNIFGGLRCCTILAVPDSRDLSFLSAKHMGDSNFKSI